MEISVVTARHELVVWRGEKGSGNYVKILF